MSTPANWFETEHKAMDLRTKTLTNESTYTAKVGGPTYNWVVDRIINVVTIASGNNLEIEVPNGYYQGQKMTIALKTLGHDETVTITTTTGSDYTLDAAGEYVILEWADATAGWIYLSKNSSE